MHVEDRFIIAPSTKPQNHIYETYSTADSFGHATSKSILQNQFQQTARRTKQQQKKML